MQVVGDTAIEVSNGAVSKPRSATLSPPAIRRLQRLAARAEAHTEILRLLQGQAEAGQQAFVELLTQYLEDAYVTFTPTDRYSINWNTGVVTLHDEEAPT